MLPLRHNTLSFLPWRTLSQWCVDILTATASLPLAGAALQQVTRTERLMPTQLPNAKTAL